MSDVYSNYWRSRHPAQPSLEDDMAAEIRRLQEEVNTLKATLGMVRQVLAATVQNLGTV